MGRKCVPFTFSAQRKAAANFLPYHKNRTLGPTPLSFGGISQRAAEETLKEAERITRKGITINTFMLHDSPVLKEFIEEMTHLNKERAFFTRSDRLGEYLLVDYLSLIRKRN